MAEKDSRGTAVRGYVHRAVIISASRKLRNLVFRSPLFLLPLVSTTLRMLPGRLIFSMWVSRLCCSSLCRAEAVASIGDTCAETRLPSSTSPQLLCRVPAIAQWSFQNRALGEPIWRLRNTLHRLQCLKFRALRQEMVHTRDSPGLRCPERPAACQRRLP